MSFDPDHNDFDRMIMVCSIMDDDERSRPRGSTGGWGFIAGFIFLCLLFFLGVAVLNAVISALSS